MKTPLGSWLRSREEDHDGLHVYRPASTFDFPRTREPRPGFRLDPAGALVLIRPGPADQPMEKPGTWTSDADYLTLRPHDGSESIRFRVVHGDDEKLEIEPEAPGPS
jgi:hypothetical protein